LGGWGAAPRLSAAAEAAADDSAIDLCATTGTVTLPGSVSVPIWGFVHKGGAADCSDVAGTATLPGLPATALPIGRSDEGLPIGVQAIGPMYEDRTTIRFAELAEREFGGFTPPPLE
jgi:Asp-tRNA(Asn)/Glu-tRNA(Gln) amidotransferase A subunit family amidase